MSTKRDWVVVRYDSGKFDAVISGMGRNAGTWDAGHTKHRAQHYARLLNKDAAPGIKFKAEGPCK